MAQTRRAGLLTTAVCVGLGALVVWRGGDEIVSGNFAVLFLLGLCLVGTTGSVALTLPSPHRDRLYRVAEFLGRACIVAFFACVVVFGLVVPAVLVSPGSGKAPDTVGEAQMLALWTLVVFVAVTVSTIMDRRRARRRGGDDPATDERS
ncbi:hypothetical protein ACFRCR_00025 [Oerskovia sp. NPDC056781]|uniref:hypothetical protein n=1 Tax=Oerskovia sp. NPDC056781 TaxID=3345942 RepID=UPI003671E3DD